MVLISHNEFVNDAQLIEIQPSLHEVTKILNSKLNEINMELESQVA